VLILVESVIGRLAREDRQMPLLSGWLLWCEDGANDSRKKKKKITSTCYPTFCSCNIKV